MWKIIEEIIGIRVTVHHTCGNKEKEEEEEMKEEEEEEEKDGKR